MAVCLALLTWLARLGLSGAQQPSDERPQISAPCEEDGIFGLEPIDSAVAPANATAEPRHRVQLFFFWGVGCPHCEDAKPFIERLRRERPEVAVEAIEVRQDPAGRQRLVETMQRLGVDRLGVPTFVLGQRHVMGFAAGVTERQVESLVDGALLGEDTRAPADSVQTKLFGRLSATELGLPLFTIALGLLDGFNPCAMWVLIFLLAMLAGQRDRTRMAITAGTFVVVSGLVYFAFMAAWLSVFLVVGMTRSMQIMLGVIALCTAGCRRSTRVSSRDKRSPPGVASSTSGYTICRTSPMMH